MSSARWLRPKSSCSECSAARATGRMASKACAPMRWAGFWRGEPANDSRPNAVVISYRALVAGGDTAGIDALRNALLARGLNAVCLFVTSLKDERSAVFLCAALSAHPPDIIVNA